MRMEMGMEAGERCSATFIFVFSTFTKLRTMSGEEGNARKKPKTYCYKHLYIYFDILQTRYPL